MKRVEYDSLGPVEVEAERLWGPQTQRSLENFPIGEEKMPRELIRAFAILKKPRRRPTSAWASWTGKREKSSPPSATRSSPGNWKGNFPWLSGRPAAGPRPT